MIKKTFYNLPEEKRQRIMDAVLKEFSSSSAEKISINRIIRTANISRGSFYQYFDDKVDLVEVLANSFISISSERVNKILSESNGDIFTTYQRLFEVITDFKNNEKQNIVMKNLIKNIKNNDDLISDYLTNRFRGSSGATNILKTFNTENLKYTSDYDVECLSQILTQVLKNAVFNVFVMGIPCEKVEADYCRKLEIIKTGAIKE